MNEAEKGDCCATHSSTAVQISAMPVSANAILASANAILASAIEMLKLIQISAISAEHVSIAVKASEQCIIV